MHSSSSSCLGVNPEEKDRLCKELTSQTVSIDNLIHLTPFPQKLLKSKLIELELAVFELKEPAYDSLKSELKKKLTDYWSVYSDAQDHTVPESKVTSLEVPLSLSALTVNSATMAQTANLMTSLLPVSEQSSSSSSSLPAIQPPQPLPDLSSILENFCPLMESAK